MNCQIQLLDNVVLRDKVAFKTGGDLKLEVG